MIRSIEAELRLEIKDRHLGIFRSGGLGGFFVYGHLFVGYV